jgi:chaperone modulatory protein CbpM
MTKSVLIIADYTQEDWYSLKDLSEITGLSESMILELIAHDIIKADNQRFSMMQLTRLHKVSRLHRDLEVNLAGVILAMSLMDELEELRAKLSLLDKHLLK